MVLVSIVVPAYNSQRTILETIQSVQDQTFNDFEIIVIDDGSTDKTLETLYSIKDARLRVFSYENAGVAIARNRGIYHSKGEFIAFLDSDDLWTSDKLESQLAYLQASPDAGVAYSWTCFMDVSEQGSVEFIPSPTYAFSGNVYERLLVSDFVHSGSNVLVRKQAVQSVGDFDQSCAGCEDWDYWLRLSAKWNFVVVPKYQILYRRASGSTSSRVESMRNAALIALDKAYSSAPANLQYLKTQTLANLHKYCASLYLQYCFDSSSIQRAAQDLWLTIRTKPQNLLDPTTQKLLVKLFLRRFFPLRLSNYVFHAIRKPMSMVDPRLQS